MSPLVTGGCEAPGWVKRSPHKRVRLDSSNRNPHSQACGTCGASSQHTVWRPRTSRSPSASARAGRAATSFTETMAAMRPQSGAATGATASSSLSEPHSSASKCEPHVVQALHGQDGGHRLPDEREHPAGAGVEEQRLLVHDQVFRHLVHARLRPGVRDHLTSLLLPFREVSPDAMLVAVAAEPESATEASDAELAGRVRGGDRAAEAELFRRLAPRVRLYGLRHLRDPAAPTTSSRTSC